MYQWNVDVNGKNIFVNYILYPIKIITPPKKNKRVKCDNNFSKPKFIYYCGYLNVSH